MVPPDGAGCWHVGPGSQRGGRDLAGRPPSLHVPQGGRARCPQRWRLAWPSACHTQPHVCVIVTEAVLRAAPPRGAGPERTDARCVGGRGPCVGRLGDSAPHGAVEGALCLEFGGLCLRVGMPGRGAADQVPPAPGPCSSGRRAAPQSGTRPRGGTKGPPASSIPAASSKSRRARRQRRARLGFRGAERHLAAT